MPRIPCATCAGTTWASHGDRHARTAKDVCPTCKGEGTVEARTGAARAASFDPATGRPFGETREAASSDQPPIRAGDHVLHAPSGETWVVAWADPVTDDLAWCGWPDGIARLSDCTCVKVASDVEHQQKLRELQASGGSRAAKALRLYGEPIIEEAARG